VTGNLPPAGFEDREDHRTPCASVQCLQAFPMVTKGLLHIYCILAVVPHMRHHRGSGAFLVRYYSSGNQVSHRLCSKDDKYYSRTCREVKLLRDDFIQTVNTGNAPNAHDITVADSWRETYQPFTVENLRHSTVYGYRHVWAQHLEKHFGTMTLREYRTHMGSTFLTKLAKTLCRSTVQHILISGLRHILPRRQSRSNRIEPLARCQSVGALSCAQRYGALHLGRGGEHHLGSG
jgi:hypothetical protein